MVCSSFRNGPRSGLIRTLAWNPTLSVCFISGMFVRSTSNRLSYVGCDYDHLEQLAKALTGHTSKARAEMEMSKMRMRMRIRMGMRKRLRGSMRYPRPSVLFP